MARSGSSTWHEIRSQILARGKCDSAHCAVCNPPTDSEIDAAIEAATANLTTSRGNHD